VGLDRAGLTIRGPHTNVRRGSFSRTRSQDFLICGGDDLFLVVVTFKRTLNVQTSKQRGKNLAADRRWPPCDGGPSHGTTGTMDNPALGLETLTVPLDPVLHTVCIVVVIWPCADTARHG